MFLTHRVLLNIKTASARQCSSIRTHVRPSRLSECLVFWNQNNFTTNQVLFSWDASRNAQKMSNSIAAKKCRPNFCQDNCGLHILYLKTTNSFLLTPNFVKIAANIRLCEQICTKNSKFWCFRALNPHCLTNKTEMSQSQVPSLTLNFTSISARMFGFMATKPWKFGFSSIRLPVYVYYESLAPL